MVAYSELLGGRFVVFYVSILTFFGFSRTVMWDPKCHQSLHRHIDEQKTGKNLILSELFLSLKGELGPANVCFLG